MRIARHCLHRIAAFAAVAALSLALGCDNELPERADYGSISGTVSYSGDIPADVARPGLQVAAFVAFPPTGPPHSFLVHENPDFSQGPVSFTLRFLRPYHYFVLAQIVDLDGDDDHAGAGGAYPSYCALSSPDGNVEVVLGQETSDLAITLYDNAGGDDPCYDTPAPLCPGAGLSALSLTLQADIAEAEIEEQDGLLVGLFETWPVGASPLAFAQVPSDNIRFPLLVQHGSAPAQGLAIYACFDRGGDNVMNLCGADDTWAVVQNGALIDFPEGKIVELELNLDTGASTDVVIRDPEGCEE